MKILGLRPIPVFALLCSLFSLPAFAQTDTTTFDVTIEIESSCSIDTPAATDVDFSTVASTATDVTATGQLNVNCTPGTSYTVSLDEGSNAGGGGIAARNMASGVNLVAYQLYSDAGLTQVWGETIGTDTVAGTGTGAVQALSVYGEVPSANSPAGTYTDTITATITF